MSQVIENGVASAMEPELIQLTVAQHGVGVGDREHLRHLVRDEDEGPAFCLQVPQDAEQVLDLVVAQRGGGLVQDHQLRVGVQRATDLQQLLLTGLQFRDLAASGPCRRRVARTVPGFGSTISLRFRKPHG